jgi:hypothetical protein
MQVPTGVVRKPCAKCGELKALMEYARSPKGGGRHSWCRECVRENDRERYKTQRNTIVRRNRQHRQITRGVNLKLKQARGGCEALRIGLRQCDFQEFDLMQWHHLDPSTKVGDVSHFAQRGNSRMMREEIRKCALLCPNCHAVIERGKRAA